VCAYPTEHGAADDDEDDDENHVLRNLRTARIQRLGHLMTGIEDLLGGEEWLAHRSLLQGVPIRFTNVTFGWQCYYERLIFRAIMQGLDYICKVCSRTRVPNQPSCNLDAQYSGAVRCPVPCARDKKCIEGYKYRHFI
jgi:hypothetical protein